MKFIIALIAFGTLLAYVQCQSGMNEAEFEIKQILLGKSRGYSIKSVSNVPKHVSIQYQLLPLRGKLYLLENRKERYAVKRIVPSVPLTWTITDTIAKKKIGTIQKKRMATGSEVIATGEFGNYTFHGEFFNRNFTIEKDGHKVAKIHQKKFESNNPYGLTVYGDVNQTLMILFTVVVDTIRKH